MSETFHETLQLSPEEARRSAFVMAKELERGRKFKETDVVALQGSPYAYEVTNVISDSKIAIYLPASEDVLEDRRIVSPDMICDVGLFLKILNNNSSTIH